MLIGRRLNEYQTAVAGRKLPGTITRGLSRFAPNFSPRVIAPKRGVGMTPFVNPERALP